MVQDCSTTGDGDLYGLGVRLGLYFQCLAMVILRNFDGSWKTISTVRTVNNIICGAIILINMVDIKNGESLSPDSLIVYYLTIVLFFSESFRVLGSKKNPVGIFEIEPKPDVPVLFQSLLFTIATPFGVWFWLHGTDLVAEPNCPAQGAFLASFSLGSQKWKIFASIVGGIFSFLQIFVLLVHLSYISRKGVLKDPLAYAITDPTMETPYRLPSPPQQIPRQLRSAWRTLVSAGMGEQMILVDLLVSIIAIVSAERMLSLNHLHTAPISESSSQMIVLFAGITSLCTAVWESGRRGIMKSKKTFEDPIAVYLYNSSRLWALEEFRQVAIKVRQQLEDMDLFRESRVETPAALQLGHEDQSTQKEKEDELVSNPVDKWGPPPHEHVLGMIAGVYNQNIQGLGNGSGTTMVNHLSV